MNLPFVLQHSDTRQIYTCKLVNHYQLVYYGVKFWDSSEEAERKKEAFLQERDAAHPSLWKVIEIEESQMKICNVKLKNDPDNLVYWNASNRPEVWRRE